MAIPSWKFILTELNGTVIGEVTNAKGRSVTLPLNRMPTAAFTIRLDHDLAPDLVTNDKTCILKCYRTDSQGAQTLVFCGPCISSDEVGSDLAQSIQVNAAGAFWYVNKRIISANVARGTALQGSPLIFSGGGDPADPASLLPINTETVVYLILASANSTDIHAYTGVEFDATASSTSTSVVYPVPVLKKAGEAIAELSVMAPYEFEVRPIEPTPVGGIIAHMGNLVVVDKLGTNRPDAIFEFGTSRANVTSYQRTLSIDTSMNRGIVGFSGWPDTPGVHDLRYASDVTSMTQHGMIEDVVADSGITDDNLRQALVNAHIAVRKYPRQTMVFTPARNATPEPLRDYFVGDTVRGRIVIAGNTRYDADVRVWGMTFTPDDEGNETVALELVEGDD